MDYLLLMGSGILVVLALGQLCVPRRTEANVLLCLLLLVCFVWSAHGIGFRLGMLETWPHLDKLHVPFLALSGPLWYVYVRALVAGRGWTDADRWHALPAAASLLLAIPFYLQSADFKRQYVEVEVSGFVTLTIYLATRVAELATLVYLVTAIRRLWLDHSPPRARSRTLLLALSGAAALAALARLIGSVAGDHTVSVVVPISIVLFAFVGLYCLSHRYPMLMALGVRAPRPRRVTAEDKDRLEHIRDRIRAARWHLDPDLKIQQLARKLEIPTHRLSELINQGSEGNFKAFVNALRIEHAKALLRDQPDRSVLDIALASGFNSVSAFYTQFTRVESVPPATYRRNARSDVDDRAARASTR